MSKNLTARLVLGAALLLCPLAGYPLGLGKLKVQSALNEPLSAEIEFTSLAESELRGLNITLASRADFEAAGAERLPFLSQIKFNVVHRPDGRYALELKSDEPISEPFLHMLVQFDWAGGRLVREYTALIDPPQYLAATKPRIDVPETPAPATAPVVETVPPPTATAPEESKPAAPGPETATAPIEPASTEAAPAPVPAEPPPDAETLAGEPLLGPDLGAPGAPVDSAMPQGTAGPEVEALAPAPAAQPAAGAMGGEYQVKPGDTLWAIAQRARTDQQLTIEQVIVAIFKNNKAAFYGDNLNNLRAGKILKLPEREVVEATGPVQARSEFRAQYDVWQEYKLKLAAGGRTLKVADAAPASSATDSKPTTQPEPAAAPTAAQTKQPDELLKIVRSTLNSQKPTADAKGAEPKNVESEAPREAAKREQSALAERVTTLEESLESKQLENRELADKLGQVRAQIKNEKRLIELESQSLAQAQTKGQASGKAPEVAPPAAAPVTPKVETPKADATPAPEVSKPEIAPAPVKPVAKPTPVPRKVVAPAPAPAQKSFLDTLREDFLADSLLPLLGGIVALAGGLILIVYMRRRKRSIAEFEESILASDAIASDSAAVTTGDSTGQPATTGDTSFLSDFSHGGMGHVQTDEVDPIAEADVYLAYGRDETAEEILREAVVKNPERHELKLKLLEIYHQRNDVAAFETLAEELYAALGGRGGKIWEKVNEMGRKLSPANPMFGSQTPANRRAEDRADAVEVPTAMAAAAAAPSIDEVASALGQSAEPGRSPTPDTIDFDFDAGGLGSATPKSNEASFDLDLGSAEARHGAGDSLSSLDLGDVGGHVIDFGSAKEQAQASADIAFEPSKQADEEPAIRFEPAPAGDSEDEIKWDLDAAPEAAEGNGSSPAGGDAQWDETATKLDLARAYIDMGDSDGARSILEEVMAEGNDQQKKQAAELVGQIG